MADTMRSQQTGQTQQPGGAAEAATEVASTAKENAASVATTAGQEAKTVARDAATHARELVDETRSQLRSQAQDQTQRLTTTLRDVAEQLRSMVEGRAPASGVVGDVTSQLADKASHFATRLDQGGFDNAMADVKRFARNRPGTFLAVAAGAGFLAGRMLKSADTHSLMEAVKPDSGGSSSEPSMVGAPMGGSISAPPVTPSPAAGTIGAGGSPLASDPFIVEP
jgi:hypothetical protein